jgi:hypothetical protein
MKRLLYLHTRDEASDSSKQEAVEAKIPDAGDRLAVTFLQCYPDLLTVGDLLALVGGRMGQVADA